MANKGVKFGDIHSFDDLGLILLPFPVPPAKPKTNFLDIPAGDGSLDLTEAHGEIKYKDREFVMKFTVDPASAMTFDEKITQVSNALNGKTFEIVFDRDSDWYWEGRCIVNEHAQTKALQEITIKAIVRPYKLKREMTTQRIVTKSTTQVITLENCRKTVVPEITSDTSYVDLVVDGVTYRLDGLDENQGKTFPNIQLKEGANTFTLQDVAVGAAVVFKYREGAL